MLASVTRIVLHFASSDMHMAYICRIRILYKHSANYRQFSLREIHNENIYYVVCYYLS
jgi:hypothetical protein